MTRSPASLLILLVLVAVSWTSTAMAAEAPLIDTRWTLASVRGEPAEPGRTPAYLIFAVDGGVSGNTGCNNLGAVYTHDGDRLSFSPIMTTRMYCAAAAFTERALVTALPEVTGWAIDGTRLTLTGADGTVLAEFTSTAT